MTRRVLVSVFVLLILFAPTASARPVSTLCNNATWAQQHPDLCNTSDQAGPFTITPGGGGGSGGGLIGRILKGLGGLL